MKIKIVTIFSLFLELATLTSCNSFLPALKTQPTQAWETALAIVGTAMAETQTAIPTATSTSTPLPTLTPLPTFSPAPPAEPGWGYDYMATVPVASVSNTTQDELAKLLFTQWLNHFKTEKAGWEYELEDFEILGVSITKSWQDFGFVAIVEFSVKPTTMMYWSAGNGVSTDNGWMRNKVLFIRVEKERDMYGLFILGTGP